MRLLPSLLIAIALLFPDLASAQETKPAVLPTGDYECRVDNGYKLRACTVTRRDGKMILTLPEDVQHLVNFEAELIATTDKKIPIYVHVTRLLQPRPWGCYSCQERCAVNPGSCACAELPPQVSEQCVAQPLNFSLATAGKNTWKGLMPYRVYYRTSKPDPEWGYDVYPLEVTIKLKKAYK
jgi:hypothetical protein